MPINGLTNVEPTRLGIVRLGSIFKGDPQQIRQSSRDPSKQVKIAGRDTDHFRVRFAREDIKQPTTEDKLYLQMYQEIWSELYCDSDGNPPKRFVDVKLISADVQGAFNTWNEEWTDSGLVRRCDGVAQQRWWNDVTLRYDTRPIPCVNNPDKPCLCKPVGRLPIILTNFSSRIGVIGYFMLTTHSVNDIAELYAALTKYHIWSGGNLTMPLFVLDRVPVEKTYTDEKDKKRKTRTLHQLTLYAGADFVQQKLAAPDTDNDDVTKQLPSAERQRLPPPQARVDQPPVANSYSLKNQKVRTAFVTMAKQHGIEMDAILDRLEEVFGVTNFTDKDIDWYQAREALGLTDDPPNGLIGGGK